MFSHRSHRSAQMLGCVDSPTDFTEFTEVLAEIVLPQISQIYTDCLGAFKGVHLSQVHQRNKRYIYIARLVHLRHVHPLKLPSVEVTLLLRRQDTSATIFRTQRICVDLCNLWEALLSSRFCEFRAICGRTAACSVGALETSAPPKNASVQSVGGSPQQQVLCKSVKSVGEYTHPNLCGFRGRPSAGAGCVRSFLRSRGRRRRRIPARYTCVR